MSTLRLCENVIFFKLIFISGTKKPTKPNDFVGLNRITFYKLIFTTSLAPFFQYLLGVTNVNVFLVASNSLGILKPTKCLYTPSSNT